MSKELNKNPIKTTWNKSYTSWFNATIKETSRKKAGWAEDAGGWVREVGEQRVTGV